jgi:hypothetical protein
MTSHYRSIAHAVTGLKKRDLAARVKVYDRARAQLHANHEDVDPDPELFEKETRELENAIANVEALAEAGRWEPLEEIGREEAARLRAEQTMLQKEAAKLRAEEAARWEKAASSPEEARLRQKDTRWADAVRRQEEAYLEREAKRLEAVADQPEELAERREEERRPRMIRALAAAASPAPSLTEDGRLDAGPNPVFDRPTLDNDLPTLPVRQQVLIETILAGLPRQTPTQLKTALNNYRDELKVRGVQPILGLLKDMAAIIEADLGASNARREWLEEGMFIAFKLFSENHALFMEHFPLDPKREELYLSTFVYEDKANGSALSKPFEDVLKATLNANRAGLTTDDFLKIVDKLAEFAKITSTLHPSHLCPADRLPSDMPPVSPKKRTVLSGFGFFERAYNLLASTATLTGPPDGNALLIALRNAVTALGKLIGF